MSVTKREKIYQLLNHEFCDLLIFAMRNKFSIEVENNYNIMAMALVTTRSDEQDFTPEQYEWMSAYSEGFSAAMEVVLNAKL